MKNTTIQKKINITTIGGGTGSFNVLTGLKNNENFNLASVVSMSDSGGSTGVLRDDFGVLPPGDIRRAVLALSRETETIRKLFEYRFDKKSSVNGHTVGNLLLTAMADITGCFEQGLKQVCRMFRVQGKIAPVTLEKSDLCVRLEDGKRVFGETNIDVPLHNPDLKIVDAWLEPEVKAAKTAKQVIENSDIIIIGPGDLYTSLIPNLLVKGISKSIKNSGAKVLYFANIMTKKGETTHFELIDFIDTLEKYLGKDILDYVFVNSGEISEDMVEKYKKEDGKKPVKLKHKKDFKEKSYKVLERDLLHETDFIRHSPQKIGKVVEDIVEGWIK